MKKKRLAKILELVERYDIETQEAMQGLLLENGIDVTQATVSRDIKELNLVKIQTPDGRSKYARPEKDTGDRQKFDVFFLNSILNVDYALNTVVIKCGVGMAQAACASFDKMFFSDVVGTIAGDDTIFVLMRNEPAAMGLCKLLQSQLKK